MDKRGADTSVVALFSEEPYSGKTEQGRSHGFGRITFANGQEYCGNFTHGRIHGLGTMVWPDGLKYVGEWKNNGADGEGSFTWENGGEYHGQVKAGKRQGVGVYTNDNVRYAGEWHLGKRHGVGAYFTADAAYFGEWKSGKRHGWGMVQFANGNRYQGSWDDDSMRGYGQMVWVKLKNATKKINLASVETFREALDLARGMVANIGALTPGPLGPYTPSQLASEDVYERYTGEWVDNQPHGEGNYEFLFHSNTSAREVPYTTVNRYVGGFKHGKRDGHGIQLFADGTVFEGEWKDNLKSGPGKIFHPDGTDDEVTLERDSAVSGLPKGRTRKVDNSNVVLTVDDILPEETREAEMTALTELVNQHRNVLKHLYGAYSRIEQSLDMDDAVSQIEHSATTVPTPALLERLTPDILTVPPGVAPMERNTRVTDAVVNKVVKDAMKSATTALQRVKDANGDFVVNGEVFEGQVPDNTTPFAAAAMEQQAAADTSNTSSRQQARTSSRAGSRLGIRRAATPYDEFMKEALDDLPPVALNPLPRILQSNMTLCQLEVFAEDCCLTNHLFSRERFAQIIEPALRRVEHDLRTHRQETLSCRTSVQFGAFVEALLRAAHYKLSYTFPYFARVVSTGSTVAQQFDYFINHFVLPLASAFRELDHAKKLQQVGVDNYLFEPPENNTIEELRRAAVRALRDSARIGIATGGGGGGGAGSQTPQPIPVTGSSGTPSTPHIGATLTSQQLQSQQQQLGFAATASVAPDDTSSALGEVRMSTAAVEALEQIDMTLQGSDLEVESCTVKNTQQITGFAPKRNQNCAVQVLELEAKFTAAETTNKKHRIVFYNNGGVKQLAAVVPDYALARINALSLPRVPFSIAGLTPRILVHYLPVTEVLEDSVALLFDLFKKCGGLTIPGFPNSCRLDVLIFLCLRTGVISSTFGLEEDEEEHSEHEKHSDAAKHTAKKQKQHAATNSHEKPAEAAETTNHQEANGEEEEGNKLTLEAALSSILFYNFGTSIERFGAADQPADDSVMEKTKANENPLFKQLLRFAPELAEAVRMVDVGETERKKRREKLGPASVSVAHGLWWLVTTQVHITKQQLLDIIVHISVLAYPQHIESPEKAVAKMIKRVPPMLGVMLRKDMSTLPGTGTDTLGAPPLRNIKAWPIKKKPPPPEDPKAKKKGKR